MAVPTSLLGPEEFYREFSGRKFGKFRAIVRDNADPKKHGRIRVYLPAVYGADLSPWVEPIFPTGIDVDYGDIAIPHVDSFVAIEFENGLVTHPLYTGGFVQFASVPRPSSGAPICGEPAYQTNASPLHMHAQGLPDDTDLDGGAKGTKGVPPSNFGGRYGSVRTIHSKHHFLELDDTPGAERVQLHHKKGSHVEFLPDGTINTISVAGMRSRSGNSVQTIVGSRTVTTDADDTLVVAGRTSIQREGEVQIEDSGKVTWNMGAALIHGKSMFLKSDSDLTLDTGGALYAFIGGDLGFHSGDVMIFSSMKSVTIVANQSENLDPATNGLRMHSRGSTTEIGSTNPLNTFGYGLFAQTTADPITPLPSPSSVGPLVHIGRFLTNPAATTVPLLQEPQVMGEQLRLYLVALHNLLDVWLTDYLAHAHPPFAPSYTSVAMAPTLTALHTAMKAFSTVPAGLKQYPLLLSEVATLSRQ